MVEAVSCSQKTKEKKERVFLPNHYRWVIVKNRYYDKRREEPGYEGFADLPDVDTDVQNVLKGVKGLGARDEDITVIEEADFEKMKEVIKRLSLDVANNWENGRMRTLVFFYYAGHGMMNNYTYAVLNAPAGTKISRTRYPLENSLRVLGNTDGSYVLGIFDCCREKFIVEATRGANTEGEMGAADHEPEDWRNCILTFGCPPNSGVSARSTIAVEFFRRLRYLADPSDGKVRLPSLDFMRWVPGDRGEILCLTSDELCLSHQDMQTESTKQTESPQNEGSDSALKGVIILNDKKVLFEDEPMTNFNPENFRESAIAKGIENQFISSVVLQRLSCSDLVFC